MAQFVSMLVLLTYAASVLGVSSLLNKPAPEYFSSPTSSLYTHMQTSTSSSTVQRTVPNNALTNDATLLHQILTQETTLRIELERKVTGILKELEQVKKTQVEAKTEQDSLKNDITLLRNENKQLKDDLDTMKRQLGNNSLSSLEPAICTCDFSNITKELQNFKREIRYTSLTFLDFQRDVTNVRSAVKNLSISMEREKTNQASINTDISVYQKNISNAIKDRVDEEILNLTTRFFSLETQMTMFDTSVRNLEQFLPRVRTFMNDTRDLQQILLRIQHEQVKILAELPGLANNTVISKKVAFSATHPQEFTSRRGQTIVFPHILSNVGGGYNNQDGVFTAPVDGVYVFFCKITQAYNNSDFYYQFILNGSVKTITLLYGRSDDTHRSSSTLIVLQLSRGDRVWIKMQLGGLHWGQTDGGDQSFSGFML